MKVGVEVAALGFLVEGDEAIFRRAGEVRHAEERGKCVATYWDGVIWLGGGDKARDTATERCVVIDGGGTVKW